MHPPGRLANCQVGEPIEFLYPHNLVGTPKSRDRQDASRKVTALPRQQRKDAIHRALP